MRPVAVMNFGTNGICCNETVEGISIEKKIERVMQAKEPIDDSAPIMFTERKDGVLPEYNIRTDKWDVAMTAMDAVAKSRIARRDGVVKPTDGDDGDGGNGGDDGGGDNKAAA